LNSNGSNTEKTTTAITITIIETICQRSGHNPVIIIWPGVGMFCFVRNKQTTRVANEFYLNAINVMKEAEAVSEYVALPLALVQFLYQL